MLETNFISAVVYIHNEGQNIQGFIDCLLSTLEGNFTSSELILVDDASSDGSLELVKALVAKRDSRKRGKGLGQCTITALTMGSFQGREACMNSGNELSIGDFILNFNDCYRDYTEELILELYHKGQEGYDIASASPLKAQRLSSKLFYAVIHRFTHAHTELTSESFSIVSRRALNRVKELCPSVPYRKLLYATSGLSTIVVPYKPTIKARGRLSALEASYRRHLASDAIVLFTTLGYRFSIGMTLIMMSLALFATIYTVVIYIKGRPVAGWTTTMLFMSFCFFALFGILAIVLKYLGLLVDLIFKRTKARFKSIERIGRG